MSSRDDLNCFHGQISNEKAQELILNEGLIEGTYLIKDCNRSIGDYNLTVLVRRKVRHFDIRRHGCDGFFSVESSEKIHGMDCLIKTLRLRPHGDLPQLTVPILGECLPWDTSRDGRTNALHRAIKNGETQKVLRLLGENYDIEAENQEKQTAVHLACIYGHESILEELINRSAVVNKKDKKDNTPLHYACKHNHLVNMVRLLIRNDRDLPEARNNLNGRVPLHEAAENNNLEAIKILLEEVYVTPRPCTLAKEMPIDLAEQRNHTDVITYLNYFTLPPPTTKKSDWFHGKMGRESATRLLDEFAQKYKTKNPDKPDCSGAFLVRISSNNDAMVLALRNGANYFHYFIHKKDGFFFIENGPYMLTLEQLVDYYSKTNHSGLPIKLSIPVPPEEVYVEISSQALPDADNRSNADAAEFFEEVYDYIARQKETNENIYSHEPYKNQFKRLINVFKK